MEISDGVGRPPRRPLPAAVSWAWARRWLGLPHALPHPLRPRRVGGHQHLRTGAAGCVSSARLQLRRPPQLCQALATGHVPVCPSDTAGPALLMWGFGSGHLHIAALMPYNLLSFKAGSLSAAVWGFVREPRLTLCPRGWLMPGPTFGPGSRNRGAAAAAPTGSGDEWSPGFGPGSEC